MTRMIAKSVFGVGLLVALSGCATSLSDSERASLLSDLSPGEQVALDTAQSQPTGATVGELMVAVLFAHQCDGIEINQTAGQLLEDRLKRFKKDATDQDLALVQTTIAGIAESYDAAPADLQDPAIACPAARAEIAKESVIGAVLSEVSAS